MKQTSLFDEIANREHEQWAHWMKYIFSKCIEERSDNKARVTTGNLIIPRELVERWRRQLDTSYSDLPDEEKKSDIKEAEKILELIKHCHEFTKGVSIPCRDCGETLSILTTESAKIIDARCPECFKAFQKKGEEHNLEIGHTRSGEALSPIALSSLADSGVFGLEKWLLGIKDEKARELLMDGIAFCDYMPKQKSETAKYAARCTKYNITTLIDKDAHLPELEARAMQAFFNSESAPLLKGILAQMLDKERRGKP